MSTVTFTTATGGSGATYSDDDTDSTTLKNGHHRQRFIPVLTETVNTAAFTVTTATASAASAAASAASAASAILSTSTTATSTTSNAIPTSGLPVSKSFTIETGKTLSVGMTIKVTATSSTANWMLGTITSYTSGTGALVMDITNSNGVGTYTAWSLSLSAPILSTTSNSVVSLSSAYSPAYNDKGSVYLCTGTFSLTYTAAATLGNGWYAYFKNDGTGVITHDPNASETIEGAATVTQQPGEFFLVLCDGTNFQLFRLVSKKVFYSARTSNTILGASDSSYLIDITSGTFSQTFTAAASLGSGWHVWLRNSGTGDITLDPNASETIDGLTSYIMYPGEVRFVQCNGSVFRSYVIQGFSRTFNSSGTFTKPPGYTIFGAELWSGGCSGQRTNNVSLNSSGGGGGGYSNFNIRATAVGTTETVTVGAGGAAVTTVAGGNVGGNTSLGALAVVYGSPSFYDGGSVKNGLTDSNPDGYAGAGVGTSASSSVLGGANASNNASTVSGSSVWGGAAGGSVNDSGVLRAAGTSVYGGNGGAASIASNGTAGSAPGGGGGATQTGTASGAGGAGQVNIWGIL